MKKALKMTSQLVIFRAFFSFLISLEQTVLTSKVNQQSVNYIKS